MPGVQRITGRAVAVNRANIDTDQIIPASWLKRVERTGFEAGLFGAWRSDPDFPLNRPGAAGAKILIAGDNFGCGSSREHAPWALEDYGFRAIVAPSFADIFYSNCTKIGLLPVALPEPEVRALMRASEAEISLPDQYVAFDGHNVLFDMDEEIKNRLLNGLDDIALSLERAEDIDRYERERQRSGPVTTAL